MWLSGEYGTSLRLREASCRPNDRRLAMAHFHLAVAHIYNSGEEGVDVTSEKKSALKHYRAAKAALVGESSAVDTGAPTTAGEKASAVAPTAESDADAAERKDLSDELDETIRALTVEIKVSSCNSSS